MPFQNAEARRWRMEEIARRGGACQRPGCGRTDRLQFAHREPDGVRGTGRGMQRRVLAVKRAPEKYILLCHWCHLRLDRPAAYVGVPDHVEAVA